MKPLVKDKFNEAIDKLLDLFLNPNLLKNKKYLSATAVKILRYIYEEGLTTSVEVSIQHEGLILLWVKDDRVLEILIHTPENIDYHMLDWNKTYDDNDVCAEKGILIHDIEYNANKLVDWLIKGNSFTNYNINNNFHKRFTKSEYNKENN